MSREILVTYVGTYEPQPQFDLVITLDADHLMAQVAGQPRFHCLQNRRRCSSRRPWMPNLSLPRIPKAAGRMFPRSSRRRTDGAVNWFVSDAIRNLVEGEFWIFHSRFADPYPLLNTNLSSRAMSTDPKSFPLDTYDLRT
jgi:hypothetical protein